MENLLKKKCHLISLISFQVCATLGTTGVCAFDSLSELGPICKCHLSLYF